MVLWFSVVSENLVVMNIFVFVVSVKIVRMVVMVLVRFMGGLVVVLYWVELVLVVCLEN